MSSDRILEPHQSFKMTPLPLPVQYTGCAEACTSATFLQNRRVLKIVKVISVILTGFVLLVWAAPVAYNDNDGTSGTVSSFFKSRPRPFEHRINITAILTAPRPIHCSTIFTLPSADSDQ